MKAGSGAHRTRCEYWHFYCYFITDQFNNLIMEEGGFAGETRGECQLNWEIVFMDRLEYEISCSKEENAFLNQVGKRVGNIG